MRRLIATGMLILAAAALGVWLYGWAAISCQGAVERGDVCIDLGMSRIAEAPDSASLPPSR